MEPINVLFDVKTEALIAILLEMHPDLSCEQLLIDLKGDFERRVRQEVGSVKSKTTTFGETVHHIEVHRKGLYDKLPQGLFLSSVSGDNKIESARQRDQAMRQARRFFHPLEQGMYQPRLAAAQMEQQWMQELPDFLEKFWGLDAYQAELTDVQRHLLYSLLPEAHRIVGDWAMTALVFEQLIGQPVQIRRVAPRKHELPHAPQPMNAIALGEGSYLGGMFQDDMPALEIHILDITEETLFDFLVGGRQRKVLETILYPHFLPFDATYKMCIVFKNNPSRAARALQNAILGFNALLLS
jgi:Type VI secretion, TssG